MHRLYNSLVGAAFNEQLRLIPAIPDIPKITLTDQTVQVDGTTMTIPSGTRVLLNAVGVNRNPRYWEVENEKPSDEFDPQRWLRKVPAQQDKRTDIKDSLVNKIELGEEVKPENNREGEGATKSLWKPPKGSFLTFSDGARVCPGKRFAQVEATAALTSIFSKWSIELDVGEWVSDSEIAKMGLAEKVRVVISYSPISFHFDENFMSFMFDQ